MKWIKKVIQIIWNPDVDFEERMFLLLTLVAEAAMVMALIGDILMGENVVEIVTLFSAVVVNLVMLYLCLKWHKVAIGAKFISIMIVCGIMPIVFYFGGGPDGGSILWVSFCAIYLSLILKGRQMFFMLFLLFAGTIIGYAVAWYRPDLIYGHDRGVYLVDSLVSILAVSIFAAAMVTFQNRLYIEESRRAREESEKAEKLLASQNSFFANMSHEIRTPINTILGLNEMILREEISDEVAEDAENIQAAGRLLLALINDILDMSKLESGQMQLVAVEYRTADMIREVVSMLGPKAREKSLEFDVNISPDIPTALVGDEVRLRQVLINVINNAIKYTKEGKVTFTAVCNEGKDDDEVVLVFTVSDTGIGIKKESIPYLFTAFKRMDEEEVHHIEGTGLGLSIVKQLLDHMGGSITVDSVYTKGSSFVVEVPQQVSDRTGIGAIGTSGIEQRSVRQAYQGRFTAPEARILVVDDNATNLMVAKKLLRETKVVVDTAGGGREALALTMENAYEVILMDHLMPEMDGIACAQAIRRQKGGLCKGSRIVALTANAGGDNRRLYEEAGFDGYLTKPVSGKALEAEVYRLLPKKLVTLTGTEQDILKDTVKWMSVTKRRRPVVITTESVADLPPEILEKYNIGIISHIIETKDGRFRDITEIDAKGLHGYMMESENVARTCPPTIRDFEEFFADALIRAKTVIHITLSGAIVHSGYAVAKEAAESFDNVYVVDSRHFSSGQGFLVLEACRMVENGMEAEKILRSLEEMREKIHTSFIVDSLDYLGRAGQMSAHVASLFNSLMMRPVLSFKKGGIIVKRFYLSAREAAWESYIESETARMKGADKGVLFITYSGISQADVSRIVALVTERVEFRNIYVVQASPAVSANCGPYTFGLFYRDP